MLMIVLVDDIPYNGTVFCSITFGIVSKKSLQNCFIENFSKGYALFLDYKPLPSLNTQ